MQYLTLAIAFAGLFSASTAAATSEVDLGQREYQYSWTVTKWQFGRGNNAYDYSFTIQGPKDGHTPGFTAQCSGINKGGFRDCTVTSHQGKYTPEVTANVNVVVDPNNPNDSIPRLLVHMQYSADYECKGATYFFDGKHDATLSTGSGPASRFQIYPNPSAIC